VATEPSQARRGDLGRLIEGLLHGERAALARLITAVESDSPRCPEIFRAIHGHLGRARVAGFTGPPGAGKSTLIGAVIAELRRRGHSVGVIAVDPSSPISGGAVLGDRVRMNLHGDDADVFIRSLAARGHLGGLTPQTSRVIDLMDAAGKDRVLVETVGAGQSEVEVAAVADCRVVVLAPGFGDDVQAIKAGILEIADILVVNKCDQPMADVAVAQLRQMLELRRGGAGVRVMRTVATEGSGIAELVDAVEERLAIGSESARIASGVRRMRLAIAAAAADHLRRKLEKGGDARVDRLAEAVHRGDMSLDEAVAAMTGGEREDKGPG
jgi:LAO/AO transport system kinase